MDIRLLAATHRDLEALVTDNRFRSDLLARLSGLTLSLPPLRERRDDILPLARQFLAGAAKRFGRKAPALAPDAANLPAEVRTPRVEHQAGFSRVLIGDASERALALQWSRLLERFLARPTALFVRRDG